MIDQYFENQWKRVLEGRDRKKSSTDNERVDGGGVGKEKMNYARNRKCWSRWELRGIVPASSPFPFPAVLFFLSFRPFLSERRMKKKHKERARYTACVLCRNLTTSFPDGLPISRTSIAVRNWSRKRAFIAPPTDEIRFRVELPASILTNVP